jgi:hypothetical protein
VAALIALLLRGAFRPARDAHPHLLTDIVEGLCFLWQQPVLRSIG